MIMSVEKHREMMAMLARWVEEAVAAIRRCLDAVLSAFETVAGQRALEAFEAIARLRRQSEVDVRLLRAELARRARRWRLPRLPQFLERRDPSWPVSLRAFARR